MSCDFGLLQQPTTQPRNYHVNTRERISQLRKACKPFIGAFAQLSFIVICMQATALAIAFWTGKLVESVSKHDYDRLVWSLGGIVFALTLGQVFQWLLARCHITRIVFDFEAHMSELTLSRISKFSIGQVVNQNSGFKQDTLKKGEAAISELVQTLFMDGIPAAVKVLTTVTALFFIGYQVGLIVAISIAGFLAVSFSINDKIMPLIRKNRKKESAISTGYWEVIKHLKLVISSAQERRATREFNAKFDEYSIEGKGIWTDYIAKSGCFREPCSVIGQVGAYGMAAFLVWQGKMTIGELVIVIGWSSIAFTALNYIGNTQRRLTRNFILVGRYFDLLDIPPAITNVAHPVHIESFKNRIEFVNVSFAYPEFPGSAEDDIADAKPVSEDDKPVALQGISLTIERGQIVALVGPSGSGKSTFVNLLQRGYDPDGGSIFVDGYDLRQIELKRWREILGIVDQDPKLWDQSLRYNISYGLNGSADTVTDARLDEVARSAKIDEFYDRLKPKGFDTLIGENGVQLSGGQRQRVAIARAIIKNPDILILDEATNALDPLNEKLVHAAIREALKGRTGIVIAHRLSTIRSADKIVVFDKGRIIAVGTHGQLLEGCPQYNELVSHEMALC
jgi:ABC-type multidrug transport system fused ATPase/permease subunit